MTAITHSLDRTLGIVLNKRPFKESGFLVELFTREYGRIPLLARGRSNPKKPLNFLELFTTSDWHLKAGQSFYFIESVDLVTQRLLGGKAIWTAYYLNELLLKLLPQHQIAQALFEYYQLALEALLESAQSDLDITPFLRQFELQLLRELGVLPNLTEDYEGQKVSAERRYYLSFEEGLLPIALPGTFPIVGELLLKILAQAPLTKEEGVIYRNMMRYLFEPLLEGKPLQSRIWMQKLYGKGR